MPATQCNVFIRYLRLLNISNIKKNNAHMFSMFFWILIEKECRKWISQTVKNAIFLSRQRTTNFGAILKTIDATSFPGSSLYLLRESTFSREEEGGPWERGCDVWRDVTLVVMNLPTICLEKPPSSWPKAKWMLVNIPRDEVQGNIYMLFAGREVRAQDQGHSFSQYGPT